MTSSGLNRISGGLLVLLALLALVLFADIASGLGGLDQPPLPDEGTQAHVFQLAVAAIVPTLVLFAATRDWTRPLRGAWPLALAGVALIVSFAGVYYIEHH